MFFDPLKNNCWQARILCLAKVSIKYKVKIRLFKVIIDRCSLKEIQKSRKERNLLEELRCKKERLIKPGMSIVTPAPQYCAEVLILGGKNEKLMI